MDADIIQLNPCNSNSCNSEDHLNWTNFSVPSEFTSKALQEKSFNSNSHNSKNHLHRTNFWVLRTYFSTCNSNFGFRVYFFHSSVFYYSKFECFNSDAIIFERFEIFKFVWIRFLVADAIKMATKGKHHEVTLKVKYEALSNSKSSILILIFLYILTILLLRKI